MMFRPCGPSACPTEAGYAVPASSASFTVAASFFLLLGGMVPSSGYPLELGDLAERELDRGLPTEDRHQHLELLRVGVDLVDRCWQRGERSVHDGDRLTHLEVDLDRGAGCAGARCLLTGTGCRLRLLHPRGEKLQHLVQGQRGGPRGG